MNNQNSLLPVGAFASPWHIHMGVDVFIELMVVGATLRMNIFAHMSLSVGAATCTGPVSMTATMLVTIWIVAAIVCVLAVAIASVGADPTNTPNPLVVFIYKFGNVLVRGFQVAMTLKDEKMNSKTINI